MGCVIIGMSGYERVGICMHEYLLAPARSEHFPSPPTCSYLSRLKSYRAEIWNFYIYYKCTFGCCHLRWGQRFPTGSEGPFQPSAGVRKRMAVGHPNFSFVKFGKKGSSFIFSHFYVLFEI